MASNYSSIDTNVIIHAIIQDPINQYKKTCSILSDTTRRFRVFDSAIIEVVYVFTTFYGKSRAKTAEELTLFFYQFEDTLDYNRTIVKMVLPYWVEHPSQSFTDCYLAFQAEFSGVTPLLTFDKKLSAQHPSAKVLA